MSDSPGDRADEHRRLRVYVEATAAMAPKARWVLATLCLAARFRPTFETAPEAASTCDLAYTRRPIPGVPTIPASPAAEELIVGRRALPAESFRRHPLGGDGTASTPEPRALTGAFPTAENGFAVPFDLVASAFVLLACWDELTAAARDIHGRLPFESSIFATNDALSLLDPACDGYIAWLRALLPGGPDVTSGAVGAPPLLVALTHDIDSWGEWSLRNWAGWLLRLVKSAAHGRTLRVAAELRDGWQHLSFDVLRLSPLPSSIRRLIDREQSLGCASTFFILASRRHPADGRGRRPRSRTLAALRDQGCEVALHGNHDDARHLECLRRDLALVAPYVSTPTVGRPHAAVGIRYHFLKCSYHHTLPLLDGAGVAYDSSLAFAEHEGYRCGISHPFHPYDMTADRPLDLVELPLALMDTTLLRPRRGLDRETALAAAVQALEPARRAGGCVAVLWHPGRFGASASGYDAVYEELVAWAVGQGGDCLDARSALRQRLPGSAGREPAASRPAALPTTSRASSQHATRGRSALPRVAHVSVVHRPDDPRIFERECVSLAQAGYEVTYLAPGAEDDEREGVRFVGLPRRPRTTRWTSAAPLLAHLHRLQPDVIHVHDPELLTLFPLLRPLGPRLVYDMHEYVSQAVAGKHYIPAPLRRPAAQATLQAQRGLTSLADGVVGVVVPQFEQLGPLPRLRAVLPNYPRYERFRHARPRPELAADERLRLIYIGSLSRSRGVGLMLDVMEQVSDGVVLYLGGDFYDPAFKAEVERRVSGGLGDRVHLLGRIPPLEVPHYLASAEVVWVPSLATGQYQRPTVATKLFEGMACGLATLVSDLPGRAAVVEGERCGVLVPPTVAGHIMGVRRLLTEREEIAAMGRRARAAVESRYSWEVIEHHLVDFYAELRAGRS